jgi:hypothetical protein
MSQSSYPIGGRAERAAAEDRFAPRAPRWLATALALAVLVPCVVQLISHVRAAQAEGRTGSLASVNAKIATLVSNLESERDDTVWYIAMTAGPAGTQARHLSPAASSQLITVRQQYAKTDKSITSVRRGLTAIGTSYPRAVLLSARSAITEIGFISSVRRAGLSAHNLATDVLERYSAVVSVLLAFENEIGRDNGDPQLFATVSALSQVSRIEQEYSAQRGLIAYGLTAGAFEKNMLAMLQVSVANQGAASNQFDNLASSQQAEYLLGAFGSGAVAERVAATERTVTRYAQGHKSLAGVGLSSQMWFSNATAAISKVRSAERHLNADVQQRAGELRRSALTATAIFGALILLLMVVVVMSLLPSIASLRRKRGGAPQSG